MVWRMRNDESARIDREKEHTLAEEIEQFKREKERIRAIIGKIGGVPTFRHKLFNVLFGLVIAVCFLISIVTHGRLVLPMIEIGVILISVKIMYLLHTFLRQMHFMFWVLSSIEWRLNEMEGRMRGEKRESNQ
ncbi:MAG: hypothetical protein NTX71_07290 [Candidatus Aureabacteria bacterium]|nr:hypothetical protein [Candidatus Auribacterota bacterium]